MDATNVVNQWIASLVRFALVGVGAYFIHKGVIDDSLWEATVPAIIGGVTAGAWSLYHKYQVAETVQTALGMPAGSNPKELVAKLAQK